METRLLENLHSKLAELENKVRAYRQEVVADFSRYSDHLLLDVSPAVQADVRHSILLSSPAGYPSLLPDLLGALDLAEFKLPLASPRTDPPQAADPASTTFQPPGTPPPSTISGGDSLHEREKEFQGLFIPSFLPLLETSPQTARPPPRYAGATVQPVVTSTTQPSPSTERAATPSSGVGLGLGAFYCVASAMDASNAPGPSRGSSSGEGQLAVRPQHVRQQTDDTASSACSDKSETKPPRSALRRSSGSSKAPAQSPRRVRFEFMGAEVLPTSSPQPTDMMSPRMSSPTPRSEAESSGSLLGVPDDDEPPPRKTSSSEALRALSRAPLDEGTMWTVVNPGSEGSSPPSDRGRQPSVSKPASLETVMRQPSKPVQTVPKGQSISKPQPAPKRVQDSEDDDESSDEEFLAMGKSKSFATKKSIIPATSQLSDTNSTDRDSDAENEESADPHEQEQTNEKDQTSSDDVVPDKAHGQDDAEDDDDELFPFETGLSAPPKQKSRQSPFQQEESDEDESSESEEDKPPPKASLYSTSPAVNIAARPQPASGSSTPTTARSQVGSVGSYKGRSLVMPVVRDPDVHAQAASLGEFNTFVGGLDGRSGMDAGDLNSFRASVVGPSLSGTPRSFTERLMMEEAMEKRREEKEKAQK